MPVKLARAGFDGLYPAKPPNVSPVAPVGLTRVGWVPCLSCYYAIAIPSRLSKRHPEFIGMNP
jgi:hypothetical protein